MRRTPSERPGPSEETFRRNVSANHTISAALPPPGFRLRCPLCQSAIDVEGDSGLCRQSGHRFRRAEGIWRFLPLKSELEFRQFMNEYRIVRQSEGWGSDDDAYYRALPRVPRNDPQRAIWRIRAENWKRLLDLIGDTRGKILDAGAGNGWLSYQLARRGHPVAALDLSDDVRDGLGAWVHYDVPLDCYQAEFDRLPFRSAQFDLVIFNAALHYAACLDTTLAEAQRVLKPAGRIVVLDSPYYEEQASGQAMIEEREAMFAQRYGFKRETRNVGFLTQEMLAAALANTGLTVQVQEYAPTWGQRWRQTWARWRGVREPARFPLIVLQAGESVVS